MDFFSSVCFICLVSAASDCQVFIHLALKYIQKNGVLLNTDIHIILHKVFISLVFDYHVWFIGEYSSIAWPLLGFLASCFYFRDCHWNTHTPLICSVDSANEWSPTSRSIKGICNGGRSAVLVGACSCTFIELQQPIKLDGYSTLSKKWMWRSVSSGCTVP